MPMTHHDVQQAARLLQTRTTLLHLLSANQIDLTIRRTDEPAAWSNASFPVYLDPVDQENILEPASYLETAIANETGGVLYEALRAAIKRIDNELLVRFGVLCPSPAAQLKAANAA